MADTSGILDETYSRWESRGESPFFPQVVQNLPGSRVEFVDGSTALMFGSCDYLGLSQRQELARSSCDAIAKFGTNTYGAQLLIGRTNIHAALEERLAAFGGKKPRCCSRPEWRRTSEYFPHWRLRKM